MAEKILIIEDSPEFLELLKTVTEQEGFSIHTARSGADGLKKAQELVPDLIILDLGLPDMDGREVCSSLKQNKLLSKTPLIIITGRDIASTDKILGLTIGADEYITKPCDLDVLIAHIRALLRRSAQWKEPEGIINEEGISINLLSREVQIEGKQVQLTTNEYSLLTNLIRAKGQTLSRDRLLEYSWSKPLPEPRIVDVYITRLRKKLGPVGSRLKTISGKGYTFV